MYTTTIQQAYHNINNKTFYNKLAQKYNIYIESFSQPSCKIDKSIGPILYIMILNEYEWPVLLRREKSKSRNYLTRKAALQK